MENMEWPYIGKYLVSVVQKHLPSWILKKWFPPQVCINSVDIFCEGIGPHIYVNPERPPALTGFKVRILNRLPFKIELSGFTKLEFQLEGRKLLNFQHLENIVIEPFCVKELTIPEKDLTDGQVRLIAGLSTNCPILRIDGVAEVKFPTGALPKSVSLETRAFIYRGTTSH